MATYTSNYGWTKPSGSDNVDISVLNDNLDDQDSTIHDAFLNMAPPFSESSTYAVDDIVLYGTGLYKCHTAVVTPGSWTGSTNWQVYKLSEGGGGGTSNYNDLTNKPSINGVTLSGNKTTSDLGIDKTAVGLGNVPNVSTNDQTPTFTEASTRNNIASGEKLSVILGKIQKFFNDLKTVAFSGSYTDLTNTPSLATVATSGSYTDLSSKPQINSVELSGNKTTSDIGINATNVMMSDGVTSVEDAVDEVMQIGDATSIIETGAVSIANGTVTSVASKKLPAGLYLLNFVYNWASNSSGIREILYTTNATAPSPAPSRLLCASAAAHSDSMYQNASLVIRLTSEQTVYFWAYQNSGSALTLWPFINAVLLKAY